MSKSTPTPSIADGGILGAEVGPSTITLPCLDHGRFFVMLDCQEEATAISILKMHMTIAHSQDFGGGGQQKSSHKW